MENTITNKDLFELIQGLTLEIKQQNKEIKEELTQEIKAIKKDLTSELEKINRENFELKEENKKLKERLEVTERKIKKFNIVVYGLKESDNEISDIQRFLDLINNTIKVDCRFGDIRDIYRIGQVQEGQTRPLSVELVNYTLKAAILANGKLLKGQSIYINHDYSPEEYKKQKVLRKYLKIARENKYDAVIKKGILQIGTDTYTYEELKQRSEEEDKIREEKGEGEVGEEGHTQVRNRETTNQNRFTFITQQYKKRKENPTSLNEAPNKRITRKQVINKY